MTSSGFSGSRDDTLGATRIALALLYACNERLYPHLPRFVQRWVY